LTRKKKARSERLLPLFKCQKHRNSLNKIKKTKMLSMPDNCKKRKTFRLWNKLKMNGAGSEEGAGPVARQSSPKIKSKLKITKMIRSSASDK